MDIDLWPAASDEAIGRAPTDDPDNPDNADIPMIFKIRVIRVIRWQKSSERNHDRGHAFKCPIYSAVKSTGSLRIRKTLSGVRESDALPRYSPESVGSLASFTGAAPGRSMAHQRWR